MCAARPAVVVDGETHGIGLRGNTGAGQKERERKREREREKEFIEQSTDREGTERGKERIKYRFWVIIYFILQTMVMK